MSPSVSPPVRLSVATDIDAARHDVWEVLTDWERQADWMVDARRVEVVTPRRTGEGVTLHVPTNLLGITVLDIMRVTRWEPPAALEVTHLGRVIRGSGAFDLADRPGGRTRLTWWEEIDPPFGAVGAWGAQLVVRPFTERLFRRSLANLRRRCEDG